MASSTPGFVRRRLFCHVGLCWDFEFGSGGIKYGVLNLHVFCRCVVHSHRQVQIPYILRTVCTNPACSPPTLPLLRLSFGVHPLPPLLSLVPSVPTRSLALGRHGMVIASAAQAHNAAAPTPYQRATRATRTTPARTPSLLSRHSRTTTATTAAFPPWKHHHLPTLESTSSFRFRFRRRHNATHHPRPTGARRGRRRRPA